MAGDQRPTLAPHSPPQRFKRHICLTVLTAVLLVGLDSSQRAGAVVTEAPRPYHPQLVSPEAVVAKSGLAINRLIAPDNHANEHVPMALELTVESGDTLIALLAQVGIVMSDAYAAVRALEPVFKCPRREAGLDTARHGAAAGSAAARSAAGDRVPAQRRTRNQSIARRRG